MSKNTLWQIILVVWVCAAIYLGVKFEDVYLAWLGTDVKADNDHITRYFAIGLLCSPILIVNIARQWIAERRDGAQTA